MGSARENDNPNQNFDKEGTDPLNKTEIELNASPKEEENNQKAITKSASLLEEHQIKEDYFKSEDLMSSSVIDKSFFKPKHSVPKGFPPTAKHVSRLTIIDDEEGITPSSHTVKKAIREVVKDGKVITKFYYVKYITPNSPIADIENANLANFRNLNQDHAPKSHIYYNDKDEVAFIATRKLEKFVPIKDNPLRFEDIVIDATAENLNAVIKELCDSLTRETKEKTYTDTMVQKTKSFFKAIKDYSYYYAEPHSQSVKTELEKIKKADYMVSELESIEKIFKKRRDHIEPKIKTHGDNLRLITSTIATLELKRTKYISVIDEYQKEIKNLSTLENLSEQAKKQNEAHINQEKEALKLQENELNKIIEELKNNNESLENEKKLYDGYLQERHLLIYAGELTNDLIIRKRSKKTRLNMIQYNELKRYAEKIGYDLKNLKDADGKKLDENSIIKTIYKNEEIAIELKYVRNYARVAGVARGRARDLKDGEDDATINNCGDWGLRIDGDLTECEFASDYKEKNIVERLIRAPAKGSQELSTRDIASVPNLVDAKFWYDPCWATSLTGSRLSIAKSLFAMISSNSPNNFTGTSSTNLISKVEERINRNRYTVEQNNVFQSLGQNEAAKFNFYLEWFEDILLPLENYKATHIATMRSEFPNQQRNVRDDFIEYKTSKMKRFRNTLLSTPEFRDDYLKKYGEYYFEIIQEEFAAEKVYYDNKVAKNKIKDPVKAQAYAAIAETYNIEPIKKDFESIMELVRSKSDNNNKATTTSPTFRRP